ncbi:hypothetical protein ACOZB2_30940, partial [Pantoea endophytica]
TLLMYLQKKTSLKTATDTEHVRCLFLKALLSECLKTLANMQELTPTGRSIVEHLLKNHSV